MSLVSSSTSSILLYKWMPLKTTGGYGSSIINWMRSIDLRRISTSPRQMKSFRCWYNDTRYWDWVGTLVSRPSSKIYLRISPAQLLGLFFFAKTTSRTLTRDNGGVVGGGCNEARGVWARGSEAGSCERVLGVMDCWLEAQESLTMPTFNEWSKVGHGAPLPTKEMRVERRTVSPIMPCNQSIGFTQSC
jgi:hypothetical protein